MRPPHAAAVAVVAGLWAAHSCRHSAQCAAGFLAMLVIGALFGIGGQMVPQVDTLTIASVVTAGAVVVLSLSIPEVRGYALFGGLAFFYGGMTRAKSVLNMMMMSFIALATVPVVWVLWGYSMAFGGESTGFIAGFFYWLIAGRSAGMWLDEGTRRPQ